MTSATLHPEYHPARSPLLAVAAVFATFVTMGIAILLPTSLTPPHAGAPAPVIAVAAQPASVAAPDEIVMQPARVVTPDEIVMLPSVDVVGTRPAKTAANRHYNVPATYKHKG